MSRADIAKAYDWGYDPEDKVPVKEDEYYDYLLKLG
jgi:hypothetical protein